MNKNYDVCRSLGSLSNDSLALEDARQYLHKNVFICRIGVIKQFDFKTQEGVVLIEEYDDLGISTRNISSLRLSLKEGDKVILLQSSINIFNESDNNYFDKNYFYILNAIDPKCASIKIDKFNISSKELGIKSDKLGLDAKNASLEGESIKVSVKSLVIEADSISFKGKVYINGKLFESHTHGGGSIMYVNATGTPTLVTGNTSGVS
ncbi:hypothetical protein DB313_04875 (plasmid) [Borrelia turcica IST7]|uniref:Uncharacterized protein n=1 Tax=Borrelia turcica IST7 TaxID=1104446 RepID=A0A386PP08_9SPIR|nr:DUF777 family protein [Borrelia turcica]AYE36835.1 hypothetical protein DB313_04875 [Borrelia turcica IST7]